MCRQHDEKSAAQCNGRLTYGNPHFGTLYAIGNWTATSSSLEGGVVGLDAPLGARLTRKLPLPEQGAAQRAIILNAGIDSSVHRPAAKAPLICHL
jgi:hypothetical protein